jgi:hypothetical protein
MPHTISVNPQNPTRTSASEPPRGPFHSARGYEVITIPMFIRILVEGGQSHSGLQSDEISICILTCIFVGKTKQVAE